MPIIWKWLVDRDDVFVGSRRVYNHLALHQLLRLPEVNNFLDREPKNAVGTKEAAPVLPQSTVAKEDEVRVCVNESTMWEAIAGHAVDHKRVPRSEWLLLLGIASSRSNGILQGDLGRLVEQDKRSVPKRTDALMRKGYITKRTTLVRGTKTSKLWLKCMAPMLPKEKDPVASTKAEMILSRKILANDLDPVPWRVRWTGADIDYTALATTVLAISREWGVIRVHDLKTKLGILGMRWQMKILSKTCRFLNSRGAIQYVAARLDKKVFKDCVRFQRDLSAEDWSIYLATGKRPGKPPKGTGDCDAVDENSPGWASGARLGQMPPWTPDKPLSYTVSQIIQLSGNGGLSNPDIYALTLGATFNRYLSAMTGSMATPGIQPSSLGHFQLRSEHVRAGKVASYVFFPQPLSTEHPGGENKEASNVTEPYGFGTETGLSQCETKARPVSAICGLGKRWRRPRTSRKVREPQLKYRPFVYEELETAEEATEGALLKTAALQFREEPPKFLLHLRVRPETLRSCLSMSGWSQVILKERLEEPSSQPGGVSLVEPDGTDGGTEGSCGTNLREQDAADTISPVRRIPVYRRQRGCVRGQRRGRGHADNSHGGTRAAALGGGLPSSSRPWVCEKCGGSWKNDIGLKYHLEKSRSPCNPSYTTPTIAGRRRSKPTAFFNAAPPPPRNQENTPLYQRHNSRALDEVVPASPDTPILLGSRGKTQAIGQGHTSANAALGCGDESQARLLPEHGTVSLPGQIVPLQRQFRYSAARHGGEVLLRTEAGLTRQVMLTPSSSRPGPVVAQFHGKESLSCQTSRPRGLLGVDSEPAHQGNQRDDVGRTRRARADKLTMVQVHAVIKDLVGRERGAILGGQSLVHAVAATWSVSYPGNPCPSGKSIQAALKNMIERKVLVDHWHAFRDARGMFSKCQLITWPNIGAFSPESLRLVEGMKSSAGSLHNLLVGPDESCVASTSLERKVRGRRSLAGHVAALDAPVYAAQVAAKRVAGAETPRRAKRLKFTAHPKLEDSFSPPRRRKATKINPGNERSRGIFEMPVENLADTVRRPCLAGPIHFLEPNEYLEDDGDPFRTDAHARPTPPYSDDEPWHRGFTSHEAPHTGPITYIFDSATTIAGAQGTWPWLGKADINRLGTSLTLSGWMPGRKWHNWSTFNHQIEKQYSARVNGRNSMSLSITPYDRFIDKLWACRDVEMAGRVHFTSAMSGEAGPHNIFIRFHPEPDDDVALPLSRLVWPPEEQLVPSSAKVLLASLVDEDSEDDEDDLDIRTHGVKKVSSSSCDAASSHLGARQPRIKRVALVTRALTSVPTLEGSMANTPPSKAEIDNPAELMAAFIAVRSVLGGADKEVDWGLLMNLYPKVGLVGLRRFWTAARKEQKAYVSNFTRVFQERLILAYENDELPMIDFDKPLGYDWGGLIRWTMQLPRQEGFRMPRSRGLLDKHYSLEAAKSTTDDWRERYFHVQTSIYSRFEAVTADAGAITVRDTFKGATGWHGLATSDLVVAKSWIKSLCSTGDANCSSEQIRAKFNELCPGNKQKRSSVFRQAISELTKQKVICRSKKPLLGGRPYRLNEWYVSTLAKMAQRSKYDAAAILKGQLDASFRSQESMTVPYTLSDGVMMALTNLSGAGRVKLVPAGLPHIPLGFEPGNYESRKYPKSYCHFELKVIPTETYKFNEEIDVLRSAAANEPPSGQPGGELPQWVDFFGASSTVIWSEILGAFCFTLATRGAMTMESACSALHPVLDAFEATLIWEWGHKTGVLADVLDGHGAAVGEWWWLAVPWLRGTR